MPAPLDNPGASGADALSTEDWVNLTTVFHTMGLLGNPPWSAGDVSAALRTWQRQNRLPETGVYDPQTRKALGEAIGRVAAANPRPAPTSVDRAAPAAPAGVSSSDVIPAGSGQPATTTPAAAPAAPVDPREAILREYPGFAPFLDHPELGPILVQASSEGWSVEKLQQRIQATHWWKTTAETARVWDAELQSDPQSAAEKIQRQMGEIDRLARRNGVALTPGQVYTMAFNSMRYGWTGEDITRAVAEQLKARAATGLLPAGEAAANADQLGKIAKAYMVPMTRTLLETWALKMMDGTSSVERFTSYVTNLARQRFAYDPNILQAIDSGMSVDDYFGPQKSQIASILEMNPNDVDLSNPRFMGVAEMVGEDGKKRAMTLSEAAQWARNQPEFDKTKGGRDLGMTLTSSLLRTLGEVA